jgi:hypothetical protein
MTDQSHPQTATASISNSNTSHYKLQSTMRGNGTSRN